ncbi:type III pantothenate kinase [Massilia sp. DWR3-1-1]|uniref:type III pantothenate kinase n=1 Tax=Massilia sp. DWR3-1-1 TaxID=2804559 RepID=UPI003CF2114F
MLLLIDAGNTRIKWALAPLAAAAGDWLADGAVAHAALGELATAWRAAGAAPTRALMSNVAGIAMADQLRAALAEIAPGVPLETFVATAERAGLRNGYRNPAQLGSDRFAAAIGAHTLLPGQAVIIATCGTATTVDAIDADGRFVGGMILPGLGLMASSLARNTAQLPQVLANAALPTGFADNTDDAILAGCVAAQAGAIERAVAQAHAATCLLSGGAARYIGPALRVPHRLIDNIVLLGLHAASLSKE